MSIHTIAVIGAGVQGQAVALGALRAGYRIVLEDFSILTLEKAVASIRRSLGNGGSEQPARHQAANLSICTAVEDAIRDAELIVETAADELETKLELFTLFDKFARPNAIFATTSAVHPTADIAEITSCPERCVALRFDPRDNPDRVAIVPGPQTSPDTMAACTDFAERLGLTQVPWTGVPPRPA